MGKQFVWIAILAVLVAGSAFIDYRGYRSFREMRSDLKGLQQQVNDASKLAQQESAAAAAAGKRAEAAARRAEIAAEGRQQAEQQQQQEILRVLKPGGTFALIAEAYRGGPLRLIYGIIMPLIRAAFLSDAEHRDLLIQAGFTEVVTKHVPGKNWICATGRKR